MKNVWLWALPLLLFVGCRSGNGSDIGPAFDHLPGENSKVLVLDDQGRGVASARVTLGGVTAATGPSGRAELYVDPRGLQRVQIDASAASATTTDALASLSFVADLPGRELPYAACLPDLSSSAGLTLTTGTQSSSQLLDDQATSGAQLSIANGASVGYGAASSVLLRSGVLQAGHLPGVLPVATSGAFLFSRGIWIEPATVTFAPAANLSIPDDLQLGGSGTARLFHLDATTGTWTEVSGVTATSSGGVLTATASVATGGLYCFASEVTALTAITGRVFDVHNVAVGGVLVTTGGSRTRTASDGTFSLTNVAATHQDGTARTADVGLRGGYRLRPSGLTATASLSASASTVDLGNLTLPTTEVTRLRVQQVKQGQLLAYERFACSSAAEPEFGLGITDRTGRIDIEDFPAYWFGFLNGHPGGDRLYEAFLSAWLAPARNSLDDFQFFGETFWFLGGRSTRVFAVDARGTGQVHDAALVKGTLNGGTLIDITRLGGAIYTPRPFDGRATATAQTNANGVDVISAFSFVDPNAEHLMIPVERARLPRVCAYDRHGLVAGSLTGANPSREHRLRTTRRLALSDWFDDVMLAQPIVSSLPIRLDPATPGETSFLAGVAQPAGNLAAVEGQTASSVFTLQKLGLASELAVTEAARTTRDLPLDLTADTAFAAPGALTGLDAAIAPADLTFDLGFEPANGLVVDVVRGVGGNHAAVGPDATFTLPALSGALANGKWLLALSGTATSGGATLQQRTFTRLDGVGDLGTSCQAVPDITSPTAGATVPAGGFSVSYTVPAGTSYTMLELRSVDGTHDYSWRIVLPPSYTTCELPVLPPRSHNPLVAAHNYTLTVTSFRIDGGPVPTAFQYPYLVSYFVSVDAAERGVAALSSRSIPVTVN